VFLIDVSGSMRGPARLPLVKQSLRLLVNKLRPDDRVALAVYAGASGLALPSTPVAQKAEILDAIDRGIQLAYDIGKANFVPGGVNRVILCTDGDFNVGLTSEGELVGSSRRRRRAACSSPCSASAWATTRTARWSARRQGQRQLRLHRHALEARKVLVEQMAARW
jgi:Mg-chelatase subunit ChlD